MLTRYTLAALLIALNTVCLQSPAEEKAAPDLAALIQKLKSDDPEERDQARHKISALGTSPRATLEAELAKPGLDPDFKSQLQLALKENRQFDVLSRFDAPLKLSVEWKDVPVKTALAKLGEKFSISVKCAGDIEEKKITASLKDATFLEALDAIRIAGKFGYQIDEPNQGNQGAKRPADEFPAQLCSVVDGSTTSVQVCGPFLVCLREIKRTTNQTLNLGTGQASSDSTAEIKLVILTEPGLPCSSLGLAKPSFKDAAGTKVEYQTMTNMNGYFSEQPTDILPIHLSISLKLDAGFKAPFSLSMPCHAQVPLKVSEKIFDKPGTEGQNSLDLGGGQLTIEEPKQENNRWSITLNGVDKGRDLVQSLYNSRSRNYYEGDRSDLVFQSTINPMLEKSIVLLNAAGKPVNRHGYSGSGSNNAQRATLRLAEKPERIIIRMCDEEARRTFKLELTGIPMP